MTLKEIREKHPTLFYENQTWFLDEPFYVRPLPVHRHRKPPKKVDQPGFIPLTEEGGTYCRRSGGQLQPAVVLAALYIQTPNDPIWSQYLWCSDKDSDENRVYVGAPKGVFEIHRHLKITKRWGVPLW